MVPVLAPRQDVGQSQPERGRLHKEGTMHWHTSKTRGMIAFGLMVTLVGGLGRLALAQSSNSASDALRIEGTWLVQVTLRNCASGAALSSVNSIVTFASGGTLAETPGATAFAPGQRSDGHGNWSHLGGQTYTQRFIALIRFDTPPNPPTSPGFLAGWQTVTHTVELVDSQNFSSRGINEFFDSNGNLYRSGCSTTVGRRFE